VLFDEQTVECVADAVEACGGLTTAPEVIAENAARFSATAFAEGLVGVVTAARTARGRDSSGAALGSGA